MNREHPRATVVFLDEDRVAGLQGRVYALNWHMWDFFRDAMALNTPAELLSLVNCLPAKYFVIPREKSPPHMFEFVRRFRDEYLDPSYCFGDACAATLKPEYEGVTDLAEIERREIESIRRIDKQFMPGEYDDADLLHFLSGTWVTGRFP